MSALVDFLTALAKTLSVMSLYEEGHPARERAVDRSYDLLLKLQEEDPTPEMTFMGSEIIYDERPLKELRRWHWARRLAGSGVQRLEFVGPVARWDYEVFLDHVYDGLQGKSTSSEVRQTRPTNIKWGAIGIVQDDDADEAGSDRQPVIGTLSYDLSEEADTLRWLQDELRNRGNLNLLEAEAIVRSLTVAMHSDQAFMIPLLKLKEFDQYTTTHSMNVSTLSMALAEYVGLESKEVKSFGVAGLLHDVGKVRIPNDILVKPGKLTPQEREVMNAHTVEGARMILEAEEFLDLAAVVAYEHHIRIDGGGYPDRHFHRGCHQASDLVHVCDVFDALRTDRPYRDAWPQEKVLRYVEEGAGKEFHPRFAAAFVRMMREWEDRVAVVHDEGESLPGTGAGRASPESSSAQAEIQDLLEAMESSEDGEDGGSEDEVEWDVEWE